MQPKDIPCDKLQYYSDSRLRLRYWKNQLCSIITHSHVNVDLLSELEWEIVRQGFQSIANNGKVVLITFDPVIYAEDLEKMTEGSNEVYILCEEEGSLQDISPFLSLVSPELRQQYEKLRLEFLRSE